MPISWLNDPFAREQLEQLGHMYYQNEGMMQMPNMNDMFPGSYLKAGDLAGKTVRLWIDDVRNEVVGDTDKWVLYFRDKQKGLVLNKTNAGLIAAMYGPDTDEWIGKEIKIYPAKTSFNGQMVDCVRVRVEAPEQEAGEDEIPF